MVSTSKSQTSKQPLIAPTIDEVFICDFNWR